MTVTSRLVCLLKREENYINYSPRCMYVCVVLFLKLRMRHKQNQITVFEQEITSILCTVGNFTATNCSKFSTSINSKSFYFRKVTSQRT